MQTTVEVRHITSNDLKRDMMWLDTITSPLLLLSENEPFYILPLMSI